MNNLDTTLKKQLLSFYGTNENDPTDKNGKTIIKPVNKINNDKITINPPLDSKIYKMPVKIENKNNLKK